MVLLILKKSFKIYYKKTLEIILCQILSQNNFLSNCIFLIFEKCALNKLEHKLCLHLIAQKLEKIVQAVIKQLA